MRYGWIVGAAMAATVGSGANAEVTREQCLELLVDAEQDREGLTNFVNALISRFEAAAKLDSADPKEKAFQDATFDFADQIDAHVERYTAAVSDLCRDKL